MNVINFILVIQTLLLSTIFCSEIRRQAGILLLQNIAQHRAYNEAEPAAQKLSETMRQDREKEIKRNRPGLNVMNHFFSLVDVLNVKIASYLEPKEVLNFEESSKHVYCVQMDHIKNLLKVFNPFFVFKENWMNRIMFSFLEANFFVHGINIASDLKIHDFISLSSINFIRKSQVNKLSLSFDTVYLLLSFMYEIFYGPNELVPVNFDQWFIIFIQKYIKYEMPICAKLYWKMFNSKIRTKRPPIEILRTTVSQVREFLILLKSKHHVNSVFLEFYRKHNELNAESIEYEDSEPLFYAPEIKFAILRLLQEQNNLYSSENSFLIIDLFESLACNFSFSQIILNRLSLPENLDYLKALTNDPPNDWRILEAIYKKIPVEPTDPRAYLWTRDPILRPFDLDHFLSLEGDKIKIIAQMIKFFSLNIHKIEIFYQFVRSGIYDFQALKPIYQSLQFIIINTKYSSNILNIILNESPVNMFGLSYLNKYIHCFSETNEFENNYDKLYIKSLKNDDPLPLIFMNHHILIRCRDLIVDKFNLKKLYTFPEEPLNVQMENVEDHKWAQLQGQTLSFKQIVGIIFEQVNNYKNIFTDQPDNEEIYKHDGSTPVSVYKFIHRAVLAPINEA